MRRARLSDRALIVLSDSDEKLRADLADRQRAPGIEIETVAAVER